MAAGSHEHIWPKALGGSYCGPLFKTREVCRDCNSRMGQWVDGAFLKNAFIQHERGLHARAYVDPTAPGILPYEFIGIDGEFPCPDDEICERWLGPSGENLYFVHGQDDPAWFGFAGGDMLRRKRHDPGRAYLWLADRGDYRALVGLASAVEQFGEARLHCLTRLQGLPDRLMSALVGPDACSTQEVRELAWIRARPLADQHLRMPLSIDFSDRFLAKLALGFGANILGPGFADSPYAAHLRLMLWPRAADEEPDLVRGGGFWQQPRDRFRMLGVEGAWTLVFWDQPEGLGLMVILPSGRDMSILIAERAAMADLPGNYATGLVYGVIPMRRSCVGPIPLPALLQHRVSGQGSADLLRLAAWRASAASVRGMDFPV